MTIEHAWGKDTCLSNVRWHFLGLKLGEWLNGAVFSLYVCAEKLNFLAFFDENHLKINEKYIFCMISRRKWRHFKYNLLTRIWVYFRHEFIIWRHFQTSFTVWNSTKLVLAPFLYYAFFAKKTIFKNFFWNILQKSIKMTHFVLCKRKNGAISIFLV